MNKYISLVCKKSDCARPEGRIIFYMKEKLLLDKAESGILPDIYIEHCSGG